MFKVINLNGIGYTQNPIEVFDTEKDALLFIYGLATAFSHAGYKIASMPTSFDGIYDTPQFLEVTKYIDEFDDNSEEEKGVFVLMHYKSGEHIVIAKDGESDFEFDKVAKPVYEIEKDIAKEGYSLHKVCGDICHYNLVKNNFVSQIYIVW